MTDELSCVQRELKSTVGALMNGSDELQWNPSIADTIGTNILSLIPNSGASGMFPVGMVCVIRLLNTLWPSVQRFPLLYAGGEGQAEASITNSSTSVMSSCCLQQRYGGQSC